MLAKQKNLLLTLIVFASFAVLPYLIFSCTQKKQVNCEAFNPAASKYLVYNKGDSVFFRTSGNERAALAFVEGYTSPAEMSHCTGKYGAGCDDCNIYASLGGYLILNFGTDTSETYTGANILVEEESREGVPTGQFFLTLNPFYLQSVKFQVEPIQKWMGTPGDTSVIFHPALSLNNKLMSNIYEIKGDTSRFNNKLSRFYYNITTGVEAFETKYPAQVFVKE
jgi:hypothetical protein